jgi:hypothetical protein
LAAANVLKNRKIETLIVINVLKTTEKRHWTVPMSENSPEKTLIAANVGNFSKLQKSRRDLKYRLLPKPLPKTPIDKVVRCPNTGTALAYIIPISRSIGKVAYYELRYAAKNGADIGEFTVLTAFVARFPISIKNLTPGTTYIFQARATNKVGFNDWSDPVNFIAT